MPRRSCPRSASEGFFAVILEDAGQLLPALGVHKVGGGLALLAHPHVQRSVCPVGKASGGIVQLVAGNAEVQQRSVDLVDAQLFQSLSRIAEVDLHHGGRQPGQPRPRGLHRVRVLIQRDEPAALFRVQPQRDLAGMSRTACGAVQIDACRVNGKAVQALVQKHRHMLKRGRVKGLSDRFTAHRAQPPFCRFKLRIIRRFHAVFSVFRRVFLPAGTHCPKASL